MAAIRICSAGGGSIEIKSENNFCKALFLGFIWFFRKRMYLEGVILFIISFCTTVLIFSVSLPAFADLNPEVFVWIPLFFLPNFVFAFFADTRLEKKSKQLAENPSKKRSEVLNVIITTFAVILYFVMIPAYFPFYDNVYDHCMALEPTGKYGTFCECGSVQEIIFSPDHRLEYIEYSEDTDCHTRMNWERENNFITTSNSINYGDQVLEIIPDFPVNNKISVTIGFDEKVIEQNEACIAKDAVLLTKGAFSAGKPETYFFKEYDLDYFRSLKCKKDKNLFVKRMIYSAKFFKDDDFVLDTLKNIDLKTLDLNAIDQDGLTALYAAVDCGFDKTLELLLKNGADPNLKNKNGCDPFVLAKQRELKNIESILRKYGAKE